MDDNKSTNLHDLIIGQYQNGHKQGEWIQYDFKNDRQYIHVYDNGKIEMIILQENEKKYILYQDNRLNSEMIKDLGLWNERDIKFITKNLSHSEIQKMFQNASQQI